MQPMARWIVAIVLIAGASLAAEGASAAPATEVLSPAVSRNSLEAVSPPAGPSLDEERDLGRGPRPHEPVFLEPAATTTRRGRLGLSSWITPGAPAEHRENPGGVAIGFTIAWPAPVPSTGGP